MRTTIGLALLVGLVLAAFVGCGGTSSGGGGGNNNPAPNVSSIAPTSGTVGGAAFTLTVTGTNFISGSVVNWNGAALTTTFSSSSSVTASVPASDIASSGTAQVTVTNPTPGGGSSAAKTFNINNPTPAVASLSQTSANAGSSDFTLTVTGSGFVSTSVVNWNGSARATTFDSGTQLTASISASDLAIAGSAHVSVSNPTPGGGSSSNFTFTITPQIGNGVALPGNPDDPLTSATADFHESNVDGSTIENGVVMDRLSVFFAHNATVAQVNSALGSIDAGIVSLTHGFTAMTVGIPRQPSIAALQGLISQLKTAPGVHHVAIVSVASNNVVFTNADITLAALVPNIQHLLPGRFPAAWSLADPAKFGDPSTSTSVTCPGTPFRTEVLDVFSDAAFSQLSPLFGKLEHASSPPTDDVTDNLQHGYDVTKVLGAHIVGANPFSLNTTCMDVVLRQVVELGFSDNDETDVFADSMPSPGTTKFVVNESRGYSGCPNRDPEHDNNHPCLPTDISVLAQPLDRAYSALYFKARTKDRWPDYLFVQSAGNSRSEDVAEIYPGTGDSRFNSPRSLAQLPDPNFGAVGDGALWTPSANDQARGFVSIKASAPELDILKQDVADLDLDGADSVADNIISVGSTINQTPGTELTQHVRGDQMGVSLFSASNADVLTVGENIPDLTGDFLQAGTSFASPQVAGLASYLWMLSPDLRGQPVAITKRIIVSNTYSNKFIDAYATALALDGTTLSPATAPMRFALLNVNHDTKFDEADIDEILSHLFVSTSTDISHQPAPGTTADFSRYDLNGDGFTTAGARRERFDLDRVGSVQFGASQYSDISETIEDQEIRFDETALTDLEILCYYAYSPMYDGDTDVRKTLLAGRCGLAVTPAKVALIPGQTQKFTANTPANDPVTWSATCGTIDASGNYTAGNDAGPCTVRATDANDPTISGTAEVTLNSGTFGAETGYTADVIGIDFLTSNEIFPQQTLSASNTSSTLKPGPLDAFSSGSYQQPGNFQPVTYTARAHADGPIVGRGVVPSSGTFTSTISCTADGESIKNSDDSVTLPFMPALTVSSGGALEFSVPPGGLTVSVSGTLTRGASEGVTDSRLFMTGDAFFDTIDAGGPDQSVEFDLNDGQQSSGNTAPIVPFSKTMHVSQPGGFDVHWQLTARCFAGAGAETGLHIARNATVTFTYTASQ